MELDDKWPPVKECPQYKYGMICSFLKVAGWETRDHIDDSEFYDPDEEDGYLVKNAFQTSKRFLQQVRSTRGYEVDCRPAGLYSTFMPLKVPENLEEDDHKALEFIIERISDKTQKPYKLCNIERMVLTLHRMHLYTFTAKEDVPDADVKTFYAMVYQPSSGEFQLEELLIKPNYDAPTV